MQLSTMTQNFRYGLQSKTPLPQSYEMIKQDRRKSPLIFKLLNLPSLKKKQQNQQATLKQIKLKSINNSLYDILKRCQSERVQRDGRFGDTHLFSDQFFKNPEAFISRKKIQKNELKSNKNEKAETIVVSKNRQVKDSIIINSIDSFVPIRHQYSQNKYQKRGKSLQQHIYTQRQNFIKNRNTASLIAKKIQNSTIEKQQPKTNKISTIDFDEITRWQTLDNKHRPDTIQSYAAHKASKKRNNSPTKFNPISN